MKSSLPRFTRLALLVLVSLFLTGGTLSTQAAPPHGDKSGAAKSALKAEPIDAELQAALAVAPKSSDWPNSNYARLLDIGNVTVKSDGTIIAKYRLTYKLFNDRERDRLAEVNLPYNSSYQSLRVISARTIKKDGTVVNVNPDDIRTSSPYSDYLMYDDAQAISFSMPAIEDDCVIDYTWEEVTHPMIMPGQFTTYWSFSGVEPVGISRLVLHVPADKPIKFKVYNDDTIKPIVVTSVDGHSKTYTWERDNIKPIDVEPSMPPVEEVSSWMEVSSLDSWQDIAHWFWELEQPQAKATKEIKTTVEQLTAGKTTDAEKARAIYDWVANRTRYVGLEFGISAFKPHAAGEVHAKQYGDCKDKATLLITMLNLAGIKAHPVLLHAEERREVDQGLPTLNAFNHCIALAEVGGKEVWLDATAETCAYGDIPAGDRGVRALVVKDGKGEFETIPMYQGADNSTEVASQVHVLPDGSAAIDMTITLRGEMGQEMRAAVRERTPDQRKEMMQKMAQQFSTGATLRSYDLPDGVEKDGPFVMTLKLQAPNFAKKTGHLLIMPLEVGAGNRRQANPFVSETRTWPVVEENASMTLSETTITLPEDFTIEDVPDDVNMTGPIQEYHRQLAKSQDGKTITIHSTVKSIPGKVAPAEYKKVKGYYDELLKTSDDWIVLKKK